MEHHHVGRLVIALRNTLAVSKDNFGIVTSVDHINPMTGHRRVCPRYTIIFIEDGKFVKQELESLGESFDFAD